MVANVYNRVFKLTCFSKTGKDKINFSDFFFMATVVQVNDVACSGIL